MDSERVQGGSVFDAMVARLLDCAGCADQAWFELVEDNCWSCAGCGHAIVLGWSERDLAEEADLGLASAA